MAAEAQPDLQELQAFCVSLQTQIEAQAVLIRTLMVLHAYHPAMGAALQHFNDSAHAALLSGHQVMATDAYIRAFDVQLQEMVPAHHHERLGI